MRIPTPVDQLPSFSTAGNASAQLGSNKWIPLLIVGGVVVAAIGVSIYLHRKQQEKINFNNKRNE